MGLAAGSTFVTPIDAKSVSDPDPLSYAEPSSKIPIENVSTAEVQNLQSAESSESGKSTSIPSTVGSPKGIYQPGWGVTNSCRLDTPDACQDVVDHIVPPRWDQRIQVREEELKRLDQEIQSLWSVVEEVHSLRNRTKNLETLMEAEIDMKRVAEAKNAELNEELESL
ncbi:hypothetical protein Tco_0126265, partial [Tanacetum coccineum]